MSKTVRYFDTPSGTQRAYARLYAQRVCRTPGIPEGAKAAYLFICAEAEAGRLVGVDDLARHFDTSERTVYRWLSELARLDVLRAG